MTERKIHSSDAHFVCDIQTPEFFETNYGIVKITNDTFTVSDSDIHMQYDGKYLVALDTDNIDEEIHALLFYLGKSGDKYKYYYVGDEVVFFTTDTEMSRFYCCDGKFYTSGNMSHYYALPEVRRYPN